MTQRAALMIGASSSAFATVCGSKPGPGRPLCKNPELAVWVIWVMAGSSTQLTQWPTSWRPMAPADGRRRPRPMAPSWLPMALARSSARSSQQLGRRPAARRPAIGRQLAAGRDRRAAVQHEAPGEGRRPAGHEPVVSAKLFLFFANRSTILYDVIDAT